MAISRAAKNILRYGRAAGAKIKGAVRGFIDMKNQEMKDWQRDVRTGEREYYESTRKYKKRTGK